MKEIWKKIKGFENYEISTLGRVKSLKNNIILKQKFNKSNGYMQVTLYNNGEGKTFSVHRLVGNAFIKNPKNLPQINHIDQTKVNNIVSNLEWCTARYNCNYGTKTENLKKRTNQYTRDGKLIKTWGSLCEIEEKLGFYESNISACCNGRLKSAYNFIWRFV